MDPRHVNKGLRVAVYVGSTGTDTLGEPRQVGTATATEAAEDGRWWFDVDVAHGRTSPQLYDPADVLGLASAQALAPLLARTATTELGEVRGAPPMPSRVSVSVTVREDGTAAGLPVVRLVLTDRADEERALDLVEDTCDRLAADLARAGRQLRRGDVRRPGVPV
jgi:hypothetical protein